MIWIEGAPQPVTFMRLAEAQQKARETGEPMKYSRGQRKRLVRDFDRQGRLVAVENAKQYPREYPPTAARTRQPGRSRRKRLLARIRAGNTQ